MNMDRLSWLQEDEKPLSIATYVTMNSTQTSAATLGGESALSKAHINTVQIDTDPQQIIYNNNNNPTELASTSRRITHANHGHAKVESINEALGYGLHRMESVVIKLEPRKIERFHDENEINDEEMKVEANFMDHFFDESELEHEQVQAMPIEDDQILGCNSEIQEISTKPSFDVYTKSLEIDNKPFPVITTSNSKSCTSNLSLQDSVNLKDTPPSSVRKIISRKIKPRPRNPKSLKILRNPEKLSFKEPDILTCDKCKVKFVDSKSVCYHLKEFNHKPFICNRCGKLFKSESLRNHHKQLPHNIRCTTCRREIYFVDASSLNMHLKLFHKPGK